MLASDFRVRILSDSSGSPGSTVIATLTNPSSLSENAVNVFTALANTTLSANTTYYVEFDRISGSGQARVRSTSSDGEDAGASSGWSIGNTRHYRDFSSTSSWSSAQFSMSIRINGFAVNSAGDYTAPALRTSEPPVASIQISC